MVILSTWAAADALDFITAVAELFRKGLVETSMERSPLLRDDQPKLHGPKVCTDFGVDGSLEARKFGAEKWLSSALFGAG